MPGKGSTASPGMPLKAPRGNPAMRLLGLPCFRFACGSVSVARPIRSRHVTERGKRRQPRRRQSHSPIASAGANVAKSVVTNFSCTCSTSPYRRTAVHDAQGSRT